MNQVNKIKRQRVELQSSHFRVLLEEFKRLIIARNFSTNGSYPGCVKEFFVWLELRGMNQIKKVTSGLLIDYLEYLTTRQNKTKEVTLSESMINQHLYILRLLFDYLLETNQIESSVLIPKNN